MIRKTKDYFDAPIIKFPINSECGIVIDNLKTKCYNCGEQSFGIRGYINNRKNVVSINGASVCLKCLLITPFQFRCYKDGHQMLNINDKWVIKKRPFKKSLFRRIKEKITR